MLRLLPAPADDLDAAGLAAHYAPPPGGAVRANMVASLDGAVSVAGRSAGLSDAADRQVFRVLRAHADVVLVGAGTARTEGYGPVHVPAALAELRAGRPAAPPVAVVTRRAALDPAARLFTEPGPRPVVITCATAPADRVRALAAVADVEVAGEDDVDLPEVLARFADRGWRQVLCEGGPSLLGALAAADRLDELALTLAPLLAGGDAGRILDAPALADRRFVLEGLLSSGGVLLTRYRRARP